MFGHRRLAIIDLSESAAQPMQSPDGVEVLTYNGEIYNYCELRDQLMQAGCTFRSRSDTEVLLQAYRHWGLDCLSRLNGMFAFAIWDEARQELFAARDRFGEKPFHYIWDERRQLFAFASEIKALFATGLIPCELNDRALGRFIVNNVLAGHEETIFRGVRRLMPARALVVKFRNGGLQMSQWTYWSIADDNDAPISPDAAAERFRELLEDSIRLRLRSDVAVGTSLSGGLDSSAIVCMIHRLGAAGQKTFSARMEDPALDEGEYIQAVLDCTGVEGHAVTPTAEELQREFSPLCFHMEEPFPATSMFAQFLVMRLAQRHGVTVLLDGQGADELLAGYHGYFRQRYGDLVRTARFPTVVHELRSFASRRRGVRALSAKGIAAALLTESTFNYLSRSRNGTMRFAKWWDRDWLNSISDLGAGRRTSPYFNRFGARLHYDSFEGPLQELLRYGDRNSMACSRELRQPFLDHRLAEFVFTLRPELKISGGMTKVVLRESMRGLVPDVILDRRDKLGYQAPQGTWLSESLRPWVEDMLEKAVGVLDGRIAADVAHYYQSLSHPLAEWGDARDLFHLLTLTESVSQMTELSQGARKPYLSVSSVHVN